RWPAPVSAAARPGPWRRRECGSAPAARWRAARRRGRAAAGQGAWRSPGWCARTAARTPEKDEATRVAPVVASRPVAQVMPRAAAAPGRRGTTRTTCPKLSSALERIADLAQQQHVFRGFLGRRRLFRRLVHAVDRLDQQEDRE